MLIEGDVDEDMDWYLRNHEKFYRLLDWGLIKPELLVRDFYKEPMLTPAGLIDRYRKAYKLNNLSQYFMHRDGLLSILTGYGRIIEFSTSHIDKRGNYNPLID